MRYGANIVVKFWWESGAFWSESRTIMVKYVADFYFSVEANSQESLQYVVDFYLDIETTKRESLQDVADLYFSVADL